MATKITKSTILGKQLVDGIVISSAELRKILNTKEVHTFSMMEEELDALIKVLIDPNKSDSDLSLTSSKRNTLIGELIGSDFNVHGNAEEIGSERVFGYFQEYIRLLNLADPLNPKKYQLGHEQGVATKALLLLQDMSLEDSKDAFSDNYKAHIRKAIKAVQILDNIDEKTTAEINAWAVARGKSKLGSGTMVDLETVLQAAGDVMDLNLTIEKASAESINKSSLTIHIRPELTTTNELTGKLSGNVLDLLRNVKKGKDTTALNRILKNVDVFNLTGSKSIMQIASAKADSILPKPDKKARKKKPRARTSRVRLHRKVPPTNQASKNLKKRVKAKLAVLQTKLLAVKRKKKFIIPTVTLKALINASLAEFIRGRMGASGDPPVKLRNQSGRFSESAQLLTLNRVQAGNYIGTYDFQQNPYGVFLPGGRLHTQQRDPKLYIEGAIRDIAVQVLRNNFRDINTRLV